MDNELSPFLFGKEKPNISQNENEYCQWSSQESVYIISSNKKKKKKKNSKSPIW